MLEAYQSTLSPCKHKYHDFRVSLCSRAAAVLVVREECMSRTLASIFRYFAEIENLCFLTVQQWPSYPHRNGAEWLMRKQVPICGSHRGTEKGKMRALVQFIGRCGALWSLLSAKQQVLSCLAVQWPSTGFRSPSFQSLTLSLTLPKGNNFFKEN